MTEIETIKNDIKKEDKEEQTPGSSCLIYSKELEKTMQKIDDLDMMPSTIKIDNKNFKANFFGAKIEKLEYTDIEYYMRFQPTEFVEEFEEATTNLDPQKLLDVWGQYLEIIEYHNQRAWRNNFNLIIPIPEQMLNKDFLLIQNIYKREKLNQKQDGAIIEAYKKVAIHGEVYNTDWYLNEFLRINYPFTFLSYIKDQELYEEMIKILIKKKTMCMKDEEIRIELKLLQLNQDVPTSSRTLFPGIEKRIFKIEERVRAREIEKCSNEWRFLNGMKNFRAKKILKTYPTPISNKAWLEKTSEVLRRRREELKQYVEEIKGHNFHYQGKYNTELLRIAFNYGLEEEMEQERIKEAEEEEKRLNEKMKNNRNLNIKNNTNIDNNSRGELCIDRSDDDDLDEDDEQGEEPVEPEDLYE